MGDLELPIRALLGLACAALLMAACATPQLSLSADERKALRIESVKISYVPDAIIWWGNGEREYLARVDANPSIHPLTAPDRKPKRGEEPMDSATRAQEVMASPEAKAHLRSTIVGMVEKRVEQQIKPKFSGNRAVTLEIEIRSFVIPSPAQRLLIGGNPQFASVTRLRDARTNAEIGMLNKITIAGAGQGVIGLMMEGALGDLEDRLLDAYAKALLRWLDGSG